jgi:O-antigen/teichoic acid export membrane protein
VGVEREQTEYQRALRLVGAGASARLVGTAIVVSATFTATLLAVRLFGPRAYGLIATGLAAVDLIAVLSSLGLRSVTVRSVAVMRADEDEAGIVHLVREVFTVVTVLGLVGAAIVFSLEVALSGAPLGQRLLLALGLGALLIASNAAGAIFSLAQGLRQVVLMELPGVVLALLQLLVVVVLWTIAEASIPLLAIGLFIAAVLVTIVCIRTLHRLLPNQPGLMRLAPRAAARFLGAAAPYAVAGAAYEVIAEFDVLTLGITRSTVEAGVYQPMLRVVDGLMAVPPTLLSAGFVPAATTLIHRGDRGAFGDLYVVVSKLAYIITFPLVVLLACFPEGVLHLVFGSGFPVRPAVVWTLLVGYLVNLAFGLNSGALVATGRRRLLTWAYAAALAVMLVLALSLIPFTGAIGAALATSSSFVVMNVAVGWALFRATGVHPFRRDMIVVLTTSFAPLIASLWLSRSVSLALSSRLVADAVLCASWIGGLIAARVVRIAEVTAILPRASRRHEVE